MSKVIFTLTGPTCGGKSTLEGRLVEEGFAKIVSHTTRPIRTGEIDGKDYHFVNPVRFIAMAEGGELAENVQFGDYRYGASKAELEKCFAEGKPVVLVCEPIGRKQIEEAAEREGWNLVRVFIDVPTKMQAERFLGRFVDDMVSVTNTSDWPRVQEVYAKRLAQVMTTERGWQVEALAYDINDPNRSYEAIVDKFDEENADAVVKLLAEMGLMMAASDIEPIRSAA